MKRCPDCRRDYYDDSLLYCLDDGTALVDGPAGEPTAILGEPSVQASAGDTSTKLFESESRTMQQSDPTTLATRGRPSWVALIAVVAVVVLAAGGYLIYRSSESKKTNVSIAALKIARL